MNLKLKREIVFTAEVRRKTISDTKGAEYTMEGTHYDADSADVLANFKNVAKELDLEALIVCAVYTKKHIDSVMTFLRGYMTETDPFKRRELAESGEGIISRLDDLRNYLDLMECIIYEQGLHPDSTQDYMPEIRRNPCKDIELPKPAYGTIGPRPAVTSFGQSIVDPKQRGNDVT